MIKNQSVLILWLVYCLVFNVAYAQEKTSDANVKQDSLIAKNYYSLGYKKLIVPAIFVAYGVASLKVDALMDLNVSTKNEINEDGVSSLHLDNYAQYVPAAMVFGLNEIGVKGKHGFKDRAIIFTTSQLLAAAMVLPLKHLVKEERPDGSNLLSFPSGHTTTAFSTAQFMFREYKDTNFLLSISGYPFAAFTGIYRTLNNKHWVGDVVAGAGFGILSTELAYHLYPSINKIFGAKKNNNQAVILPYYQKGGFGLGLAKRF